MKNLLIYLGILMVLLITPTTAAHFGIKQIGLTSTGILLAMFLFELLVKHKTIFKLELKEEYSIMILLVAYAILQFLLNKNDRTQNYFFFIVVPILISVLLKVQDKSVKRNVSALVILFFFAECGMSFYERALKVNIFPYQTIIDKSEEVFLFRASAFLGHPLNNALAVSIMLGFIMVSKYKSAFKLSCLACGFASILCFNARGAIIIWAVLGLYFLYIVVKTNDQNVLIRLAVLLVVLSFVAATFYAMVYTTIGGRIINQDKILDESALTRLNVLNSFDFISGLDLFFGNPDNYILVTRALGAGGVENSYIVLIIYYGVLIGGILMIMLFFLTKKHLMNNNTTQNIILVMSFIIVGSTNNGLADPTPWTIFLICATTFTIDTNKMEVQFFMPPSKRSKNTLVGKSIDLA